MKLEHWTRNPATAVYEHPTEPSITLMHDSDVYNFDIIQRIDAGDYVFRSSGADLCERSRARRERRMARAGMRHARGEARRRRRGLAWKARIRA